MRNKLASIFLLLSLFALVMPASSFAQERGRFIRRDKNGYRVGDGRITFFDGPGLVNYEYKHRWMPGAAGAATVIGTGAAAGAVDRVPHLGVRVVAEVPEGRGQI